MADVSTSLVRKFSTLQESAASLNSVQPVGVSWETGVGGFGGLSGTPIDWLPCPMKARHPTTVAIPNTTGIFA